MTIKIEKIEIIREAQHLSCILGENKAVNIHILKMLICNFDKDQRTKSIWQDVAYFNHYHDELRLAAYKYLLDRIT